MTENIMGRMHQQEVKDTNQLHVYDKSANTTNLLIFAHNSLAPFEHELNLIIIENHLKIALSSSNFFLFFFCCC